MRTVTVVYEIVDESEWAKINPLRYKHNGLQAVRVGIGDALKARDALSELMPILLDEYYPDFANQDYKAAMEYAKAAMRFGEAENGGRK